MDNTEYLKQLADQQKQLKQVELEKAKADALTSIEQQKAQTLPTYQTQRQQASTQSLIGAKNFAEYLANRNQLSAGLAPEAQMRQQANLQNTLGGINTAETNQLQQFTNQANQVNQNYGTSLQQAQNEINTNLAQNLYNERIRAEQEAYQRQKDKEDKALAWYNATKEKSSGLPEGTMYAQNGKVYQIVNGNAQEYKYNVKRTETKYVDKKKVSVPVYETPKQEAWNKKGYFLNSNLKPIVLNDKDTYQQWWNQYDGNNYLIRKGNTIQLTTQGIIDAVNNGFISKAEKEKIKKQL